MPRVAKYSRNFAKNVRENFRKSYARAADLVARYYGLTPEMEILLAEMQGNKFYLYKKAVKRVDRYYNSDSEHLGIQRSLLDFILPRTEFHAWWVNGGSTLGKI